MGLSRYDVMQEEGGWGRAADDPTLKCGKRSKETRVGGVKKSRFLYDVISGQALTRQIYFSLTQVYPKLVTPQVL